MLGGLFKSQKLQKYPFRNSKGLFSRGFILVTNLLVDVLVKKSVALLERVDSPEQIFHRRFSLGAPVERAVSLATHSCFKTKEFSHECEAKDA